MIKSGISTKGRYSTTHLNVCIYELRNTFDMYIWVFIYYSYLMNTNIRGSTHGQVYGNEF